MKNSYIKYKSPIALYFSKFISMLGLILSLNTVKAQQKLSVSDSLGIMPAFRFYQLNGTVFTSDSLAKNKQIMLIYIKKDCPYCEQQGEIVSKLMSVSPSVEFVFITKSDTGYIRDYSTKYKLAGNERVKFLKDNDLSYRQYYTAY